MSSREPVIAVTCLALEARIALGPDVSVLCDHASRLVAALEAAVKRGACGIISFGIAGGLAPDLSAGDWVIASGVRCGNRRYPTDPAWTQRLLEALPGATHADIAGVHIPIAEPLQKRQLHVRTGAVAVDMESHIAAELAARHGLPFAAYRVIIDAADRQVPPAAVVGLRQDGTADIPAIIGSVLRQPRQLPTLISIARDSRIAEHSLRQGRRRLAVGLGFPYRSGSLPISAALPQAAASQPQHVAERPSRAAPTPVA
jgi:hopanoid-associated phosphorylase